MSPEMNLQMLRDAEAREDARKKEARDFRRQIVLLAIGALIGFLPSSVIMIYQGKLQREQLIMDRHLSALKDFTEAALAPAAEITGKYERLELKLANLTLRSPDASHVEPLLDEYMTINAQCYSWMAQVSIQAPALKALFNFAAPQISLAEISASDGEDHIVPTDIATGIKVLRKNIQKRKQIVTKTSDTLQEGSRILAAQIK